MKLPLNQGRNRRNLIATNDLWIVNYYQGKYQEALECLVGGHGGESPWGTWWSWSPWLQKGLTYVALNQRATAMACFDTVLSYADPLPAGFGKFYRTGIALACRGHHARAALEFEKAGKGEVWWSQRKLLEVAQAQAAVLAGDTDRALSLLEQLIPKPGYLTVWDLRLDPVYNPLRKSSISGTCRKGNADSEVMARLSCPLSPRYSTSTVGAKLRTYAS